MLNAEEIEKRKPLWQAFSDLWLDNELQDFEIDHIVDLMKKSGYDLVELEKIFYSEVAPAVYQNTFSMTGEWTGFEAEQLFRSITDNIKKQETNFFYRIWVKSSPGRYLMTKMVEDDWLRVISLCK